MMSALPKFQNLRQYVLYSKIFRAPGWFARKFQYRNLDTKTPVQINMRLGHKIKLVPTQAYLKRVVLNRSYHDEGAFFLEPFLMPGAVILDIGANIGLVSCAYAKHFRSLSPTIHAIEAVEQNFNALVSNIELNGFKEIKPYRLALGDEEGEITFKLPSKEFTGNAVGTNVLCEEDRKEIDQTATFEEKVPLTTLDLWAIKAEIQRCDFIKIDVEGAELNVFKGGREFIKRTRPVIQCEFNRHWLEKQGKGIRDFVDFFTALDYAGFVDAGDKFVPLEVESFHPRLVDLVFFPKEKVPKQ